MSTTAQVYALILCGGIGARLWPLSRKSLPKQFAPLFPGGTLFERTVQRNTSLGAHILVASNSAQWHLAENQLAGLGVHGAGGLIEPVGRNTAPAVALVALGLNPDDVLIVCPSDHIIRHEEAYQQAMVEGIRLAQEGFLVTFGITPTSPETGFGYIEAGAELPRPGTQLQGGPAVQSLGETLLPGGPTLQGTIPGSLGTPRRIQSFREKPDLATAQMYLESGRYSWNSGMFCFTAGTFLQELKAHSPEVYQSAKATIKDPGPIAQPTPEAMGAIPSLSLDYAVMEKTTRGVVVPCDLGWSDVGSLEALAEHLQSQGLVVGQGDSQTVFSPETGRHPETNDAEEGAPESASPDAAGSTADEKWPEPILVRSTGNVILGSRKQIALVGVDDLIVVETDDALLITRKGSGQEVKSVVDILDQRSNRPKDLEGPRRSIFVRHDLSSPASNDSSI